MAYHVKTEAFEGPLDLLLHLINRLEIDIYDIPMAEITEQYLIYVHSMSELKLDGASEYLVMAATLLAIKSRMLLPKYENDPEESFYEEEDPRDELVERLIEYKKFKEAADTLKQQEYERGQIFMKPPSDLSIFAATPVYLPLENGATIYDMLGAYHKLLRRKKLHKPLSTTISKQGISIEERMGDVLEELNNSGERQAFSSFFHYDDRVQIVVTFLAVLELMKRNAIIVEQAGNFADIYLAARLEVDFNAES